MIGLTKKKGGVGQILMTAKGQDTVLKRVWGHMFLT